MTRKEILSIRPPKTYEEGLINFIEGMDNVPEQIDYIRNGYNSREIRKMELLIRIELLKCALKSQEDEEVEGRQEIESVIKQCIQQYNEI